MKHEATLPGPYSQLEATQYFDESGRPTVMVVDNEVISDEMKGWAAVAMMVRGAGPRVWKFLRRKWGKPIIIGGEEV